MDTVPPRLHPPLVIITWGRRLCGIAAPKAVFNVERFFLAIVPSPAKQQRLWCPAWTGHLCDSEACAHCVPHRSVRGLLDSVFARVQTSCRSKHTEFQNDRDRSL